MKIQIVSDLHLDFAQGWEFRPNPEADIIIIAGDVFNGTYGIMNIVNNNLDKKIIFVAGNHDFYGQEYFETIKELEEYSKEIPNFFFLENDQVIIDGQKFVGATFWAGFKSYDDEEARDFLKREIHQSIQDFRAIKIKWRSDEERYFVPDDSETLHNMSINYLDSVDIEDAIMITHFPPSYKSIEEKFKIWPNHEILNNYFFNPLDDLIKTKKPKIWVHGHVHSSWDYDIGDTRVICNPKGYGQFENTGFYEDLLIKV